MFFEPTAGTGMGLLDQDYAYVSPAYDLGRGKRSDPTEGLPQWTPGPGNYEAKSGFHQPVVEEADPNSLAAKKRPGWS